MDINEIKKNLEENQKEILDLWRSLWHNFKTKWIKRKRRRDG